MIVASINGDPSQPTVEPFPSPVRAQRKVSLHEGILRYILTNISLSYKRGQYIKDSSLVASNKEGKSRFASFKTLRNQFVVCGAQIVRDVVHHPAMFNRRRGCCCHAQYPNLQLPQI